MFALLGANLLNSQSGKGELILCNGYVRCSKSPPISFLFIRLLVLKARISKATVLVDVLFVFIYLAKRIKVLTKV